MGEPQMNDQVNESVGSGPQWIGWTLVSFILFTPFIVIKLMDGKTKQAKHNTYIHVIKLIIMKTAITTTKIINKAKKLDAAAFDKWLTKNDVNYDWLDVTLTDMNDGWYNIVLEDDTNICFVDGKYMADQAEHGSYIHGINK